MTSDVTPKAATIVSRVGGSRCDVWSAERSVLRRLGPALGAGPLSPVRRPPERTRQKAGPATRSRHRQGMVRISRQAGGLSPVTPLGAERPAAGLFGTSRTGGGDRTGVVGAHAHRETELVRVAPVIGFRVAPVIGVLRPRDRAPDDISAPCWGLPAGLLGRDLLQRRERPLHRRALHSAARSRGSFRRQCLAAVTGISGGCFG